MKKFILYGVLILLIVLLAATTQALASPASIIARNTSNPHGPGGSPTAEGTGLPPTLHVPGGPATAKAGLHGKPQIYRGTIAAVEATSVSLTLLDGTPITIGLLPATKIHVPGPQSMGDTLSVGMRVAVMAFNGDNNSPVAKMVVVVPGQPVRAHRVGKVTAYTPASSITIQATDGTTYTFALTANLKLLPPGQASSLAVGSLVTIIAPRVPSSQGWTAMGIVVHPPQ